jgi:hypothetical protein
VNLCCLFTWGREIGSAVNVFKQRKYTQIFVKRVNERLLAIQCIRVFKQTVCLEIFYRARAVAKVAPQDRTWDGHFVD